MAGDGDLGGRQKPGFDLSRRTLRTAAAGADTIAWFVGGPPNVASGSYCWNRAARSIDLPLSGTASTEADVDELVGFLRETCVCD